MLASPQAAVAPPASLFGAYSDELLRGLNELRQKRHLCDVVLRVGKSEMYAHKVVLASCSPYFKAMFTCSLSESQKGDVDLQCVDAVALRSLIDFAYTGEVNVTQANVQCLLTAANLLQLKVVAEECCLFLSKQLHAINCIGIFRFAEMHACYDLYHKSIDFLLENFSDVMETEEFIQLSEDELIDIVSNDELVVDREETVLRAVCTWVRDDPDARGDTLHNLLRHVRLPLLSVQLLNECLESNQLISKDTECRQIINDALEYKKHTELRLRKFPTGLKSFVTKPRQAAKILCAVGGKNGLFQTLDRWVFY